MAELAVLKVEYDPEAELLSQHADSAGGRDLSSNHSTRTAPIFTSEALDIIGPTVIPQRAVYGTVISSHCQSHSVATSFGRPSKLYVNTNAPFSAVVCGLQGSGKSHSTSVLLEGCLIQDHRLGTLPAPLCGLLFHFDSAAGSGYVQPCEAAYLASLDAIRGGNAAAPDVTVLVMPNRVEAMRAVYANLPGVKVEALRFASGDISGERLLAMMKVDESNQMPLYMELVLTLLRDMEVFDYNEFRAMLEKQRLNGSQKSMLNLRLALLDSCLKGGDESNCVTKFFKQGTLTIVDLSSPFIDSSSACGFFDIILSLFVEAEVSTGKIIVLDEAHKYLSDTNHSSKLTDSLLSIIRQQRHLNARVIISTQEPTVVPSKFLELSSFIIAHRFSSPKWLQHLAEHVSAAQTVKDEIFEKIIDLRTGEGIMFAPSGLGIKSAENDPSGSMTVAPFGQGYLVVHSRQRITRDGGHSLLAVRDEAAHTRIGRVAAPNPTKGAMTTEYTFTGPSSATKKAPPFTGQSVSSGSDVTSRSVPVPVPSVLDHPQLRSIPSVYSTPSQVLSMKKPPIRTAVPANTPGLTPVTTTQLASLVSEKKKLKFSQPQSVLNHNTHLPAVLRILRQHRDRGIALVPFGTFKKTFKVQYPAIDVSTIPLKLFLVEETKKGAITFGYQGQWQQGAPCYLKLVGE